MTGKQPYKELDALISMIDEPSEEIYQSIKDKIASYGSSAIPFLEEAWLKTQDDDNALRIESLIEDIRFNDLYIELNNWAQFYNHDLLKGYLLVTRFRYPDFEELGYIEQVSKLKQNFWLEINHDLTALERIKVLNHIFYDVYQFRGVLPQQVKLASHFLTDLLDTKKGSAIALGTLYLYIAQSLDIPIFGLDLHHHFALAYMEDNIPVKKPADYTTEEVLFYIAVVNKGSVFTRNEIKRYLSQVNIEDNPVYYKPCPNVMVIRRLLTEIAAAYELEDKPGKARLARELINALD